MFALDARPDPLRDARCSGIIGGLRKGAPTLSDPRLLSAEELNTIFCRPVWTEQQRQDKIMLHQHIAALQEQSEQWGRVSFRLAQEVEKYCPECRGVFNSSSDVTNHQISAHGYKLFPDQDLVWRP